MSAAPPPVSQPAFAAVPPGTLPDGAVPAATLIVSRPTAPGGPDEMLLMRRTAAMAFAPGAWVFPGGRVDADDVAWARSEAATLGLDPADAAARWAAIRETIEEAGLVAGLPPGTTVDAAEWRRRLAAGETLAALAREVGVRPDVRRLLPFARWCPSHRERRVFDTRFYVWAAPPGQVAGAVDGTEHDDARWVSAAGMLAAANDRAAPDAPRIIFPTARNLERLALLRDVAGVEAQLANLGPVPLIVPATQVDGDGPWLVLPDGAGYPHRRFRQDEVLRG